MRTHSKARSLAGRWKFGTDPEGKGDFGEPDGSIESWQRQVTFFDTEYDDAGWDEIAVPACWQTQGCRYNGIAWYRTRFHYQPDGTGNVIRLHFKGVDYFADAWLNGYYLGSHEGFFHRFSFDASRWIRPGENLLVVKVDAPNLKRLLVKGALQGINWDCNDPTLDPGGIWNDVQLLASRDLYIDDLKVRLRPTSTCSRIPRVSCAAPPSATPRPRSGRCPSPALCSRTTSPANRTVPVRWRPCRPDSPRSTCGWTWRSRGCGGRGTWESRTCTTWRLP